MHFTLFSVQLEGNCTTLYACCRLWFCITHLLGYTIIKIVYLFDITQQSYRTQLIKPRMNSESNLMYLSANCKKVQVAKYYKRNRFCKIWGKIGTSCICIVSQLINEILAQILYVLILSDIFSLINYVCWYPTKTITCVLCLRLYWYMICSLV